MAHGSRPQDERSMKKDKDRSSQRIFGLLKTFCPPRLLEEIEGDLMQRYESDIQRVGPIRANVRLFRSTLGFLRPGIVFRNRFLTQPKQSDMLKSYFKTMARNAVNQKFYAAITLSGLTVGITFALLAGIFIREELRVNSDLKDVDQLYLLEADRQGTEGNLPSFFVPALLSEQAADKYPGIIKNHYRFYDRAITVSRGDTHFRIQSMIGDSTLLGMFGFSVLHGRAADALNAPDAMVITEKIARQYFNKTDVAGESLTISTEDGTQKAFRITAVIADLQDKNSVTDFMNMDAQVFLSLEAQKSFRIPPVDSWSASIITYVKLTPQTSSTEAAAMLNDLLAADAPKGVSAQQTIKLSPLRDYYRLTNHGAVNKLIISLIIIATLILVLAITNFVNISVARSFSRLKEVGIRKVIGGLRKQIVIQFLAESLLFAVISGGASLILYELFHRYFSNALEVSLPSLIDQDIQFWIYAAAGIFVIGMLAGVYPSLYLSTTKTMASLKGRLSDIKGTIGFSRALITIQFLIAIFVLSGSLVLSRQVSYFMQTDLGYDKSMVLVATSVPRMWSEEGFNAMDAAKAEFLSSPKITSASLSWGSPNFNFSPYSATVSHSGHPADEGILATMSGADPDYMKVYGLQMVSGKFLSEESGIHRPFDIVINERAQKALNVNIGDKVNVDGSDQAFTITGIVKDFHFESMHQAIKPVVFMHNRDFRIFRYFSFKLGAGSISESVEEVERLWKKVFPNDPFEYNFADEKFATLYKTELQLKKASSMASVLILLIVLTGVLGLVSLSVAKRAKEIGIRKVLGASASDVLLSISREYAVLMMASFAIGVPLSYLFGSTWIERFAYRIDLSWWMFVLPAVFLFFITLAVVGAQSLRTAMSSPVDSLRCD